MAKHIAAVNKLQKWCADNKISFAVQTAPALDVIERYDCTIRRNGKQFTFPTYAEKGQRLTGPELLERLIYSCFPVEFDRPTCRQWAVDGGFNPDSATTKAAYRELKKLWKQLRKLGFTAAEYEMITKLGL